MTELIIASAFVRATVTTTAGMLLDAVFTLGDREVRPFARAPWIGERDLDAHVGHLRVLGGEFVGVPFGSAGAPDDIDSAWADITPSELPEVAHGRSADAQWSVVSSDAESVVLGLDYPEHDDLARLERTIRLRPHSTALDFELTLIARRPCRVPVGLHPILRLPEETAALTIAVDFDAGYTYPGTVAAEARTAPASTFVTLDAVPARGGDTVDLSALPLSAPTEDVVLLAGVSGCLVATFADDRSIVTLDWDRAILPSLLMWMSDRALVEEPWNGRYRGLGLEPIASAFDLPAAASRAPNPLSERGYATTVAIEPGVPVVIRYSIEVSSLDEYV